MPPRHYHYYPPASPAASPRRRLLRRRRRQYDYVVISLEGTTPPSASISLPTCFGAGDRKKARGWLRQVASGRPPAHRAPCDHLDLRRCVYFFQRVPTVGESSSVCYRQYLVRAADVWCREALRLAACPGTLLAPVKRCVEWLLQHIDVPRDSLLLERPAFHGLLLFLAFGWGGDAAEWAAQTLSAHLLRGEEEAQAAADREQLRRKQQQSLPLLGTTPAAARSSGDARPAPVVMYGCCAQRRRHHQASPAWRCLRFLQSLVLAAQREYVPPPHFASSSSSSSSSPSCCSDPPSPSGGRVSYRTHPHSTTLLLRAVVARWETGPPVLRGALQTVSASLAHLCPPPLRQALLLPGSSATAAACCCYCGPCDPPVVLGGCLRQE